MRRRAFSIGVLSVALGAMLPAQTPAAAPLAFEVASVKASPPFDPAKLMSGQMHIGMSVDAARVDIGSLSLADLIRVAYRVKPHQISGPDWMAAQRFDILAKIPEGANKDQVPDMLQALLAERFKLAVHRETRDLAAYALVVGKNGPKLKEAPPETAPPATPEAGAAPPPPGRGGMVLGSGDGQVRISPNAAGRGATVSGAFGQMKISQGEAGALRMEFDRITMPMLADMLTNFGDHPVFDLTQLKGTYAVSLDLSADEMRSLMMARASAAGIPLPPMAGRGGDAGRAPADAASTPGGSSIFTAIQQLGLRLDSRKMPTETIVVDHLEKTPTEN